MRKGSEGLVAALLVRARAATPAKETGEQRYLVEKVREINELTGRMKFLARMCKEYM